MNEWNNYQRLLRHEYRSADNWTWKRLYLPIALGILACAIILIVVQP